MEFDGTNERNISIAHKELPIHAGQSSCSMDVMSWHVVSSYFINSPKPLLVGLKLLTVAEAAGDVIPNLAQLRLCKHDTDLLRAVEACYGQISPRSLLCCLLTYLFCHGVARTRKQPVTEGEEWPLLACAFSRTLSTRWAMRA